MPLTPELTPAPNTNPRGGHYYQLSMTGVPVHEDDLTPEQRDALGLPPIDIPIDTTPPDSGGVPDHGLPEPTPPPNENPSGGLYYYVAPDQPPVHEADLTNDQRTALGLPLVGPLTEIDATPIVDNSPPVEVPPTP